MGMGHGQARLGHRNGSGGVCGLTLFSLHIIAQGSLLGGDQIYHFVVSEVLLPLSTTILLS